VEAELKTLATIDLGGAKAKIVEDLSGRRCLSLELGGAPVLFTASHALLVREILDFGLQYLVRVELDAPSPITEEKSP
jgi:hypothetical protein